MSGPQQATLNDPYRLNFNHADVPSTPDHSQQDPGPPREDGRKRAGYTRAIINKKMALEWAGGAVRADGRVCLYATAVIIDFLLDPITVAVSSDYSAGSCPYRVTLKHEVDDHAKSYIKIFLTYRDSLVAQLNAIPCPTKSKPTWIRPNDIDAFEDALGDRLKTVILDMASKVKAELEADRKMKDSPDSYKAIYGQCPADEW